MAAYNYENILYDKTEGIATITLNRPNKLNALNAATYNELHQALDDCEGDPDVRVVVITGAGERAFCAGIDLSIFGQFDSVAAFYNFAKNVDWPLFTKIERLSKPVIAAVNGFALGAGLELALVCDMTVASERATFGLPENRVGAPPAIAAIRLEQAVGSKKARELMLTCESVGSTEAERIGLVNASVPHDQLYARVREMADKIKACAPLSVAATKSLANRHRGDRDVAHAIDTGAMLFQTEDGAEGFRAFLEKREPRFKGR